MGIKDDPDKSLTNECHTAQNPKELFYPVSGVTSFPTHPSVQNPDALVPMWL